MYTHEKQKQKIKERKEEKNGKELKGAKRATDAEANAHGENEIKTRMM